MESKGQIVKGLVKVIKRLSLNESNMNFRYDGFRNITKKIEKPSGSFFDRILLKRSDKQELSELLELTYYRGKTVAYLWVLEQLLGSKKTQKLLFRGILGEKNVDKYGNLIKGKRKK